MTQARILTIGDLRPASGRWTFRRKADVVLAVERGHLTPEQAIEGLGLSADELASWRRRFKRHDFAGLRETRLQEYR